MKRSEIYYSASLIPLDIIALVLAFLISYFIRDSFTLISPEVFGPLASKLQYFPGGELLPFLKYWRYVTFIIPVMVFIFALNGLYAIRSTESWSKRFFQILIGVSVGEFAILLLFLLKKDFFLPRSIVLYSWLISTFMVFALRYLAHIIRYAVQGESSVIRVGIVGHGVLLSEISKRLKMIKYAKFRTIFTMDTLDEQKVANKISKNHIDQLIVANDEHNNKDLILLRNLCLQEHIEFLLVPSLFSKLPTSYEVGMLGDLPMVFVKPTPLDGWGRVWKRLFDLIVSFLMIVIGSPIFLLVALLIKITSPGPLLYKQKRIGYHKKTIYVWKFRTLKYEYCTGVGYDGDKLFEKILTENPDLKKEWEENHKLKNDPRVSRYGSLLRRSSMDELPQLFNVFAGTLSMVGPRPIVESEVEKYGDRARILFTVKPGLTGLWQVSGRSNVSYQERVEMDAKYIDTWNIFTDLKIIFLTAWQVITKGEDNGAV